MQLPSLVVYEKRPSMTFIGEFISVSYSVREFIMHPKIQVFDSSQWQPSKRHPSDQKNNITWARLSPIKNRRSISNSLSASTDFREQFVMILTVVLNSTLIIPFSTQIIREELETCLRRHEYQKIRILSAQNRTDRL